ncbi:phosphatase PAP2 family protein [Streptomyces endophyticus]|uniref:Phosphatase PAP2 family protein n=1 Tax=Streptomyces endophyticus TaxID=714166 RepID=A0ABU6F253_9ACTN|nr:phosphatase PAP2 family protein [Streptomyces endophyticus]MEB8338092.1 phosphatase PAP2 family protein [Streptomyces endophyticus]
MDPSEAASIRGRGGRSSRPCSSNEVEGAVRQPDPPDPSCWTAPTSTDCPRRPPWTPRYRADLAEVRAYGAANSTVRTERQTETATFWFGSSLTLCTEPLRVALFHAALVNTQIATSDSKYAYLRWRPVTAIRTGTIAPDPTWTPPHVTPAHPDYPSGHTTYAGAAEAILSTLARPTRPASPSASRSRRTCCAMRHGCRQAVSTRLSIK